MIFPHWYTIVHLFSVHKKVYRSTLFLLSMLTKLHSFAAIGLHSERITVEVGSIPGESKMLIVGLGDTAVQESKQRVKLALRASGYRIPTGRTITVNLAPADVKKVGPRYDLPIALGILLCHECIDVPHERCTQMGFLGELALDGGIRHVSGVLSSAIACREQGIATLVVPKTNAAEAALISGITVIGVSILSELLSILKGELESEQIPAAAAAPSTAVRVDFCDIHGQEQAKRSLEIAAAGGHNVLMSGTPGSGKTLLAQALRGILPPLSREESIEVTQIYSVANLLPAATPLLEHRPFRSVHHTASGVAIVGGGQIPGPGEISLAHKGVLFLDELTEFPPHVLEVLRQPLEERTITITRAQGSVQFPADILLVAAMNPPEWSGGTRRTHRRISSPFLDRIDLHVSLTPVPVEDLQKKGISGERSQQIALRVQTARERQRKRFTGTSLTTNKEMGLPELRQFCSIDDRCEALMRQAVEKLKLSARSYHRTLKVARTIADLTESEGIELPHVAEALQYRSTDTDS